MSDFKDKRFSAIVKDPRFKKIPTKHVKTKIDKRFSGLFSDKQFELKYTVDKRGSPLDHKISEDYRKFYQLDEKEQGEDSASGSSAESDAEYGKDEAKESGIHSTKVIAENGVCKKGTNEDESKKDTDEEMEESDGHVETTNSMIKQKQISGKLPNVSGDDESSTSTDTETSDDEQEKGLDHRWQELDADAPRGTDITKRLAVCNMNWDRLRAEDFLVVFNSFKPPDGVIHSVKVYPSEYGLERMEKEKLLGPTELIEEKLDDNEETASDKKISRFHLEKLRQYQLNRLKYFFAVVDCDSPKTADVLYEQLNGMEFESSGCILDLRFIPDDMTFEQEPASVANSVPDPSEYKPMYFVTSALNQVKVDLTWDETDPRRKEVLEKAFTDPESIEKDLKEYLASPSESEDDMDDSENTTGLEKLSAKQALVKYKALIQELEEKEKSKQNEEEYDMEITWDTGLKDKTEKLVKEKEEKALKESLTPFEEKLQKKKELKKLKKGEKIKSGKEVDDINSSEESEIEESEGAKDIRASSKWHKKKKLKSVEDCKSEVDEKKLAELELLMWDPNEKEIYDSEDSSNETKRQQKKKKKKKKKKAIVVKKDTFVGDVDDPRFAAVYTDPLFHIDPSDPKFKERNKMQAFIEATQRKKYGNSNATSGSREVLKQVDTFPEGLTEESQKPTKVNALKEKLSPFCKKMQKKRELRKQKGNVQMSKNSNFLSETSKDSSPFIGNSKKQKKQAREKPDFSVEGHSTLNAGSLSDIFSDLDSSKKMKKKKIKKKRLLTNDLNNHMSSTSAAYLNGSRKNSDTYLKDGDDSDVMIFASSSTKRQMSSFPPNIQGYANSPKKKAKKFHV